MTASSDVNVNQATAVVSNGTSNGASHSPESAILSTLPGPDHDWRVSLKDKVIADMYHALGACHYSRQC